MFAAPNAGLGFPDKVIAVPPLSSENLMPATLQRILALPVRALAWLGGQGTRAIAALVFIGVAVPPLGERLKPHVTEAVFLLLCISFLRVDLGALRDHLRRPGLVLAATAWTTLAVPLISAGIWFVTGLDTRSPDLYLALMLQAVASPMMASPALAAVMGLDSTLVLVTLVTSTVLIPITAPLFAYAFFGTALTLSPLGLGLKLVAILAGSLLVSGAIRLVRGRIRHQAARPAHRWTERPVSLCFCCGRHGQRGRRLSGRSHHDDRIDDARLRGVSRTARRNRADLPQGRPRPRDGARPDGLAA